MDVLKTIGGEGAVDASTTTNFRGLLGDKERIKNLDDACDSELGAQAAAPARLFESLQERVSNLVSPRRGEGELWERTALPCAALIPRPTLFSPLPPQQPHPLPSSLVER